MIINKKFGCHNKLNDEKEETNKTFDHAVSKNNTHATLVEYIAASNASLI